MIEQTIRQQMVEIKVARYLKKSKKHPVEIISMLLDEKRDDEKLLMVAEMTESLIEGRHVFNCPERTFIRKIERLGLKGILWKGSNTQLKITKKIEYVKR